MCIPFLPVKATAPCFYPQEKATTPSFYGQQKNFKRDFHHSDQRVSKSQKAEKEKSTVKNLNCFFFQGVHSNGHFQTMADITKHFKWFCNLFLELLEFLNPISLIRGSQSGRNDPVGCKSSFGGPRKKFKIIKQNYRHLIISAYKLRCRWA